MFPRVGGKSGKRCRLVTAVWLCPALLLAQALSQKLVIASTLPLQGTLWKGRGHGHGLPAVTLL